MVVILGFIIGVGYAILRKQDKEINSMLKITEYMIENNVDDERFDRTIKFLEK